MQQKIKNLKKNTKVMLIFLVALILVASATGITLYTQEVNNRVLQTQEAYWGLVIPNASGYDEAEQIELQNLLDSREFMFNNLHFTDLQNLQQDFDLLHQQVATRIDLDKKYATKKSQAEGIKVLKGANATETEIFNIRKADLLQFIESRQPFDLIEEKIKILQRTNTDIQQRLDKETVNATRQRSTGSSSGNGGYYPQRQSTGNSSSGGNRGQGERPNNSNNISRDSSRDGCVTLPDGSQRCPWNPPF